MTKNLLLLIHSFVFLLTACNSKIEVQLNEKAKPEISSVKVEQDQLIVVGRNLDKVTTAKIEGSNNHSFSIESKTNNQLILNAKSALTILAGQTLNLFIADANASATFPIHFELGAMGATSGQVLRFNGTTWGPSTLSSSQVYAGIYDALTDTPDIVGTGGPAGTYYIVTTAGSQDLGSGMTSFDVGDWVIFNGATWDKVAIGTNTVSSFNTRTGAVVPLSGDYSWSMLTKAAGKLTGSKISEVADVDVTGIQDGDILQWDVGASKWQVTAIPTPIIAADSIDSSKISDNSISNSDISGTAEIAQSKILNLVSDLAGKEPLITAGTTAQYLRGDKSLATLNTTVVPEGTGQYFTQARVLATPLLGYATGTAIPITALDTIPQAIGKLDAQDAAMATTFASKAYVDSVAEASQWTTTGSDIYYADGSVGIGNDSPSFPLDILSSESFQLRLAHYSDNNYDGGALMMVRGRGTADTPTAVQSGNTMGGFYFRAHDGTDAYTTSAAIEVSASETHSPANKGTHLTFETTTNGASSRSERMRITNSGKIGIGTTSPDAALHIYSTPTGAQPNRAGIIIEGEGASFGGRIATRAYSDIDPPFFSGYRALGTKAAPLALTSGKKILNLIGYGYDGASWAGNSNSPLISLETSETWSATNKGSRITFFTVANGTTATDERMRIDHDGEVGIGITAPAYKLDVDGDINLAAANALRFGGTQVCTSAGCTSSSDRRLKENILPLKNPLQKIIKLQGVEYDYKDRSKYGDQHQVGVIAQDVEKVFPEVVQTDSKSGLKSVAYDHLVAPIIEAMKELFGISQQQSREIASLKEKNDKLEKENTAIRTYLCQKDPLAPICQ